jgi:hypothetical protein
MKTVKPTKFRVKISSCGTNTFNATYERMEDESALRLLVDAVQIISEQTVGKDNMLMLQYDLAKILLMTLNGYDKQKLLTEIEFSQEKEQKLLNKWLIKVEE